MLSSCVLRFLSVFITKHKWTVFAIAAALALLAIMLIPPLAVTRLASDDVACVDHLITLRVALSEYVKQLGHYPSSLAELAEHGKLPTEVIGCPTSGHVAYTYIRVESRETNDPEAIICLQHSRRFSLRQHGTIEANFAMPTQRVYENPKR